MSIRAWCMGPDYHTKERKCCHKRKKEPKDLDLFRDTRVRYMGYSNEVGEAFRGTLPNGYLIASYLLSSAYVLADIGAKSSETWKAKHKECTRIRAEETIKSGIDATLWQSLASIVIPGLVINRICALTRFLVCKSPGYNHACTITTAVGLLSIPIIINPLDRFIDSFMDTIVRPKLRGE